MRSGCITAQRYTVLGTLETMLKYITEEVQNSPFIMLYLGSIGMEGLLHVYKRTILQRNNNVG